MKKLLLLLSSIVLNLSLFAQMPVASKIKNLGVYNPGTIVQFNANFADTLKSADTLFYKVAFNHDFVGYPYLTYAKTIVAADTTADVVMYQSVNGSTNWIQIQSGSSPSNYSTTIAKAATGGDIDFWKTTIWFSSQYLGIRLIQRTKTSSKAVIYGTVRFNKL